VGVPEGEQPAGESNVYRYYSDLDAHFRQDPEAKSFFTPDATMAPVFGNERQKAFGMAKHLKEHLTNPNK
jgi:chromatin remodeling complex protein RSC6